jgi:microcystin-dependent protein
MWSGSTSSVPSGWALCNGSNGTPDLQNRFVIGAGSSYSVGNTGGSKDAIVVSHTHTMTGSTDLAGIHNHLVYGQDNIAYPTGARSNEVGNVESPGSGGDLFSRNTSSAGGHTHTINASIGSAGSSGTNANLPPYYALAYIMKT